MISSPPQRATTSDGREPVGEPAHDLDQHLVADAVAEAVVDRLEPVEVDDEQPRRHAAADDARVLGDHRLLEGAPVRGAGELVAARVRLLGGERRGGRLAAALGDQEHARSDAIVASDESGALAVGDQEDREQRDDEDGLEQVDAQPARPELDEQAAGVARA